MKIISISGDIGVGKDTVVKIIDYLLAGYNYFEIEELLQENSFKHGLSSFHRHEKFADTMKDITCKIIGCTREQLEDRDFKDSPLGEEFWCYVHSRKGDEVPVIPYKKNGPTSIFVGDEKYNLRATTPRDIMKTTGTTFGRNRVTKKIWAIALINKLSNNYILDPNQERIILISDTRFPEETSIISEKAEYKMFLKVTNCNVERTSFTESDTALDDFNFDHIIKNDFDFKYLIPQVDFILGKFLAIINIKEKNAN